METDIMLTATLYRNGKKVAHGNIDFVCPNYVVIGGKSWNADFDTNGTYLVWDDNDQYPKGE